MDDKIVKKIIDSGQKIYSSDWTNMESRLSETFGPLDDSETPFDRELREKLDTSHNYKSNWSEFMGVYKGSRQKRRRFLALKLCEIILVISFLFSIDNIANLYNVYIADTVERSNNKKSSYDELNGDFTADSSQLEVLSGDKATNDKAHSLNQEDQSHTTHELGLSENSEYSQTSENSNSFRLSHSSAINMAESNLDYISTTKTSLDLQNLSIHRSKELALTESKELTLTEPKNPEFHEGKKASELTHTDRAPILSQADDADEMPLIASLNLLVDIVSKNDTLQNQLESTSTPYAVDVEATGSWAVLLSGGITLNVVHTPEDEGRNFASYDHSGFGLKLSAKMVRAFKNSDLILGLEYQTIKYDNRNIRKRIAQINEIEQVQNYNVALPTQLHFKVIRVPLEYRRYYNSDSQARLFVLGGASAAYTISSNYYLTEYEVNPINQDIYQIEVSPALENYDFGGRMQFGLRAGIGAESTITDQVSFHIQGGYEHFFGKGVGPSLDKIHGITLDAGVRIAF